jgi:hypothetical protein
MSEPKPLKPRRRIISPGWVDAFGLDHKSIKVEPFVVHPKSVEPDSDKRTGDELPDPNMND